MVNRDPGGLTGGEEGRPMATAGPPGPLGELVLGSCVTTAGDAVLLRHA